MFRAFATRAEASTALADTLAACLGEAVRAQGHARLVVSGGTSPAAMFRELREKDLPWASITVVPSDERDVPADHADRNDAMIRRELLAGPAAGARLLPLIPPGELPDRFDAVVLGMGADGHTASLFPGSPDLPGALASDQPLAELDVPQLNMRRVSLTPSALLNTGRLFLLIFGDDKRRVFEEAQRGHDIEAMPVRVLLEQGRAPLAVYWAP